MTKLEKHNLKHKILNYIESKGKLKASLLYKLEKWLLKEVKNDYNLNKKILYENIITLINENKICLIVPHLYKIKWNQVELKDLKYLEDGKYLIREMKDLSNNRLNNYYFDSRKSNHQNKLELTNKLRRILIRKGEFKKKIILYLSDNDIPLNIYEEFEGNYKINFTDFNMNKYEIKKKFNIPLKEQQNHQIVIYNYRRKFMCFYITIIEAIQHIISELIINKNNIIDYKKKINDLGTKFAFYCDLYVTSDWIDVAPNIYRWESFFKYYNLPFRVKLTFENVRFSGRTFEFFMKYEYTIKIKNYAKETIQHLKNLGYEEKGRDKDTTSIGFNHNAYIPSSSIEYFYFCGKYFFYYYLFLLFSHSFEYIRKEYSDCNFTEKDKDLYKVFLPTTNLIFNFSSKTLNKEIIFKYYSLDPNELEIIYNKFLLPNVRLIEKKLYKYFLIKTSLDKKKY